MFQTHLLTSDENQEIIHKSDVESCRKEKLAEAKAEAYKKFLENEKEKKKELAKKKKITVRQDSIKARSLPATVRSRGSGGRGHGRRRRTIDNPKL